MNTTTTTTTTTNSYPEIMDWKQNTKISHKLYSFPSVAGLSFLSVAVIISPDTTVPLTNDHLMAELTLNLFINAEAKRNFKETKESRRAVITYTSPSESLKRKLGSLNLRGRERGRTGGRERKQGR